MVFEQRINLKNYVQNSKEIKEIKEVKDLNSVLLENLYNNFCKSFVDQLKEDYNFKIEVIEIDVDKDNEVLLKFSIDMPRRKKKKEKEFKRISIKHAKVEPFNTDKKEGVK